MNILMLGGAKRVSMGRKLIAAGNRLGKEVKLFSYELSEHEPIALIARVIVGKRWTSPDILDHLKKVVREHNVDIVLPFVDGAVEIAASLAKECRHLFVPCCAPEMARRMFDKKLAAKEFAKFQIPTPATFADASTAAYPCIAKPAKGSASKGIVVARTPGDLAGLDLDNYLLQEYVEDADEYTVDCYVSMADGSPLAISPRRRIATAGGEATDTVTVSDREMECLTRSLLVMMKLKGAVTVQYLRSRTTGKLMLMEINPRLGGGVVTSTYAGADIPSMILTEALGNRPEAAVTRPGVRMKRYMEETVFYEG